MHGVNVMYPGECGDACRDNSACYWPGQYCRKPPGNCGGFGYCDVIPSGCTGPWDPVCGCNSMTYYNAECAAAEGVNVDYPGSCSCPDNAYCPAGSFCDKPDGYCSGWGMCQLQPDACEPLVDPVCGCDNVTYENDCEAAMAGTVVQYTGPCMPAVSDFDDDGDVDQSDFGILQRRLSGKGVSQPDAYCQPARMDADADVDGGDVLAFLVCLSGPNTAADSNCIDQMP